MTITTLIRVIGVIAAIASIQAFWSTVCLAQPMAHYQNWADLPPGEIGRRQLERGGPLRGYFQPVEMLTPKGCHVAFVVDKGFQGHESNHAKAGMLVGNVYRTRITHIPGHAGFEVYPSIEVIDRLHPPEGLEDRFPIPIEITQEDLDRVIAGEFVVRVVYLEDPTLALPQAQNGDSQRSSDVGAGDDPLIAADRLGRPMAIVRIGARVPDELLGGIPSLAPPIQILAPSQHGHQEDSAIDPNR